jgi:hypothetical protein
MSIFRVSHQKVFGKLRCDHTRSGPEPYICGRCRVRGQRAGGKGGAFWKFSRAFDGENEWTGLMGFSSGGWDSSIRSNIVLLGF